MNKKNQALSDMRYSAQSKDTKRKTTPRWVPLENQEKVKHEAGF